ncbi:MAG: hypothetical protein S4CHLAM20_03470 [Chlamydiia bacterium]|nr:hypothetical protein [Chlamydiia bacterium]
MNSVILLATAVYAIIGGPSVGKTSIIKQLKSYGYQTTEEAATRVIKENFKKGEMEPWAKEGFQQDIYNLQRKLEAEALSKNRDNLFVDRGFLDNIIYLEFNNRQDTQEYANLKKEIDSIDITKHYKAVFFIEPHSPNFFEVDKINTDVRRESNDEALRLNEAIKNAYAKHFNVIVIPGSLTPKERADLILSKISPPKKHSLWQSLLSYFKS